MYCGRYGAAAARGDVAKANQFAFFATFPAVGPAWAGEMVQDTVILDAYRLESPDHRTECFGMVRGRSNIERTRWFGAQ